MFCATFFFLFCRCFAPSFWYGVFLRIHSTTGPHTRPEWFPANSFPTLPNRGHHFESYFREISYWIAWHDWTQTPCDVRSRWDTLRLLSTQCFCLSCGCLPCTSNATSLSYSGTRQKERELLCHCDVFGRSVFCSLRRTNVCYQHQAIIIHYLDNYELLRDQSKLMSTGHIFRWRKRGGKNFQKLPRH